MATKYDYTPATYTDPMPGRADDEIAETRTCDRCGGAGGFREWGHIDGGACFKCHGNGGRHDVTVAQIRKEARSMVASENRRRRAAAKAVLAHAENLTKATEQREEWARVENHLPHNQFLQSLWERMNKSELTEKQLNIGADVIKREEAKMQERTVEQVAVEALAEGRQTITAKIRNPKFESNTFAYNAADTLRALFVLENGQRLYGTVPQSVFDVVDHIEQVDGLTVTMTVAVTPSKDDPSFGFTKRPTKVTFTK